MSELRDYEEWHKAYDDPDSGLSWRLRTVRGFIEEVLDHHAGPIRILSSCSGDGRDLLEVLQRRSDAERVRATLIELHPDIAQRARRAAETTGANVEVRTADAGLSDSYQDGVPADLVLLIGIFGNICDADLGRLIGTAPQFCEPGATLLWSRGRHPQDRNVLVRELFVEAGFVEVDYIWKDIATLPAVGVVRYQGKPESLVTGQRLFTFLR